VSYPRPVITPQAAEELIFDTLPIAHREDCALPDAQGRILRADLTADRDLPPFDRVTMDGFALRSAAAAKGLDRFRIEGLQAAGMRPFALGPDDSACLEIMTGAVLPAGADCVVPYEHAVREGDWAVLTGKDPVQAGQNVHRRGSDHRMGEVVVPAGVRLTGREIAVAAACGYAVLTVSHSPRVAIISSGDELVEVDALVAPHQIRRSNDHALRAALIQAGYPRADRFHLRDVRHEIEHRLWHILAEYDVVIITGGVSKGQFDFFPSELERQGVRKVFHGVAQRPGKPFWFGVSARMTPVFALPGNPVSAYTCLHRYVLPALDHAGGIPPREPLRAVLAEPVAPKVRLAWFLPVRISSGPQAELVATPGGVATSGDFGGLVQTDGFVELPATDEGFPAGYMAPFRRWV
jgi:molybdopterin molybdotransferase